MNEYSFVEGLDKVNLNMPGVTDKPSSIEWSTAVNWFPNMLMLIIDFRLIAYWFLKLKSICSQSHLLSLKHILTMNDLSCTLANSQNA